MNIRKSMTGTSSLHFFLRESVGGVNRRKKLVNPSLSKILKFIQ